jgi:protein gp37
VRARIRFLSCEPLLERITLRSVRTTASSDGVIDALHGYAGVRDDIVGGNEWLHGERLSKLDWVICGGESGPNARPMHPGWARSLRDQCVAAGVPFLFKQWGDWAPVPQVTGPDLMERIGKRVAGRARLYPDSRSGTG